MLPLTHVGNHVGGKSGGKPQVLFPHTTLLQGILTGSNPSKLISLYHPRQEMGSPAPLHISVPALGVGLLLLAAERGYGAYADEVEGIDAHPVLAHPDAATLGGLPGGDRPLDFFKDTQIGKSS